MDDDVRVLTRLNARFLGGYVDTYRRIDGGWPCVHGCLWPPASF